MVEHNDSAGPEGCVMVCLPKRACPDAGHDKLMASGQRHSLDFGAFGVNSSSIPRTPSCRGHGLAPARGEFSTERGRRRPGTGRDGCLEWKAEASGEGEVKGECRQSLRSLAEPPSTASLLHLKHPQKKSPRMCSIPVAKEPIGFRYAEYWPRATTRALHLQKRRAAKKSHVVS